jgi:hypothetical protein
MERQTQMKTTPLHEEVCHYHRRPLAGLRLPRVSVPLKQGQGAYHVAFHSDSGSDAGSDS